MPNADSIQGEPLLKEMDRDKRAKVIRFKQWMDNSSRTFAKWRDSAIESYRFVGNEQWRDEDIAAMEEQRRPALTINKIFPQVMWLLGVQRQQRTEPQMLPFEPGDARRAELMGLLYKWAGTNSREPVVDSMVFQDKIISGMGFWKCSVNFEDDIQGDMRWERVHPLSVFPDPNFMDQGWGKADYVQQADWMSIEAAMDTWPKSADRIRRQHGEWVNDVTQHAASAPGGGAIAGDSLSDSRTFWDPETQRARIVECWYYKRIPVTIAINNETGDIVDDPDEVESLQQQPEAEAVFSFPKRKIRRAYVAHYLNDILLDDGPTPFDSQTFPIFPTLGYYFWRQPFGMVEVLKDLQREHNVRRSTITEMVRRAALSGFFNDETKGASSKELSEYATGIGKVINHRGIAPQEIKPPELPQTLVFLDQKSDTDMNAVTNIHSELLGNKSQRFISGRAINARQSSGMAVQEPLLESFRQDKELAARFMVSLIQQYVTVPRAARILGSLTARQPTGPEAQLLGQLDESQDLVEIQELLEGTFNEKWDVVMGTKPWEPSAKQQVLSTLLDLADKFGPESIPPDLMVDALADAGVLTEQHAERVRAFVQQKQQLQQATAATAIQSGAVPPSETIQ